MSVWSNVLDSLQNQINKQSFDMWLKDTELISINGNISTIKVVDDVALRHITDNYRNQIESIMKSLVNQNITCEFVTTSDYISAPVVKISENPVRQNVNILDETQSSSSINPNYSFDNFVVGSNNQLAHAAAISISRAPGTKTNPLFIYGGVGLGKTHLMQAIGNYIIKEKPYLRVLYAASQNFLTEFVYALRTQTISSFKIKYMNVDILLIDDIQNLENKPETQNEFFNIFNDLHQKKKQIVISSDRPPKQLSTLEDRLRTRYEWGMIIDIQAPNLETREAILRNKAESIKLFISDEVINYIARRIKSNIRALESALNKLKMVSETLNEPINIENAKLYLKDLFDEDINKKVSLPDIMEKVALKYGITVNDLTSKNRHSKVVLPRFISMYIARKLIGITTTELGHEFGNRDHSTVVNAINQIEQDIAKDLNLKDSIEDLISELKS